MTMAYTHQPGMETADPMQNEPSQVKYDPPTVIRDQRKRVVFERPDRAAFRRPEAVSLVAMYTVLCLTWAAVSYGFVPKVISAGHNQQSLLGLDWLFQEIRSAPLDRNLDRWNAIATAVLLAIILHLGIVFFVRSI